MWPGLVGKGPDSEPPIDLDTMLALTAAAEVDGVRFDGVDLFLSEPHTNIDSTDDDLKTLADKLLRGNLVIGSLVAPVWTPTGGGSAMGTDEERDDFSTQVRKACAIAPKAQAISASGSMASCASIPPRSPAEWAKDPLENTMRIAETFREACSIADAYGERLAAEGEICWGGMHSWKRMVVDLLEMVNRPEDPRLPGGHGPHAALSRSALTLPKTAFCQRTSTGQTLTFSTKRSDKMTACAAALDHRFSCGAERRHRQRLRFAR